MATADRVDHHRGNRRNQHERLDDEQRTGADGAADGHSAGGDDRETSRRRDNDAGRRRMTAHRDTPDSTARAFWVAAPGRGEIRSEAIGVPRPGEVLVRTRFSGISRGTEALVFEGRVPPSEYERMRAPFQAGAFPAPVKYGYASVGVVESGPDGLVGRHVFALYPHQTRYVVPETAVSVIPDGVPPARAVLAANLETAITGLWDAAPRIGDRIVVIGGGTVGCLVAWLAQRIPGCDVTLVDIDTGRARTAA